MSFATWMEVHDKSSEKYARFDYSGNRSWRKCRGISEVATRSRKYLRKSRAEVDIWLLVAITESQWSRLVARARQFELVIVSGAPLSLAASCSTDVRRLVTCRFVSSCRGRKWASSRRKPRKNRADNCLENNNDAPRARARATQKFPLIPCSAKKEKNFINC